MFKDSFTPTSPATSETSPRPSIRDSLSALGPAEQQQKSGNETFSPAERREQKMISGSLRGAPLSSPATETWWVDNATQKASGIVKRAKRAIDKPEWPLPGKGPTVSNSPRIPAAQISPSKASLAEFKRARCTSDMLDCKREAANADHGMDALTASIGKKLRLSGSQEAVRTPLLQEDTASIQASKPAPAALSVDTTPAAIPVPSQPKTRQQSSLARDYDLRTSVEGAVVGSLLSPPRMDDNNLPSAFLSPRATIVSGTSVLEEGGQEKQLSDHQFSNPFGIDLSGSAGIATKLRLALESSPLEPSPVAAKGHSLDSSTDSEVFGILETPKSHSSRSSPISRRGAIAYDEAFPSLAAVSKRELASIMPGISTTSSSRRVESPFLPIVGGLEEGEIACDQPGFDIVASVDDFSDMRAFLTPSPATLGGTAHLGPPKLQRGTVLDLHDGPSVSDRAPSSKPTSSKTYCRSTASTCTA